MQSEHLHAVFRGQPDLLEADAHVGLAGLAFPCIACNFHDNLGYISRAFKTWG